MKSSRKIIILLIMIFILISGCNKQKNELIFNEVIEPKNQIAEETIKEINPETKEDMGTVLWILEKDWKVTMNLPGFEDYEDYQNILSRFLLMNNKKEKMTISIFAENISSAKNSVACREFYINKSIESYLENQQYTKESSQVIGASKLSLSLLKDFALAEYDLYLALPKIEGKITQKRIHAYKYYDSFCFDFHLSKYDYKEEDKEKLYNILDSIEYSPIKDILEVNNSYTLLLDLPKIEGLEEFIIRPEE